MTEHLKIKIIIIIYIKIIIKSKRSIYECKIVNELQGELKTYNIKFRK